MAERLPILGLTVDAVGARDRDDAFWVERVGSDYVATVCITDVAGHVPIGSPDDLGAAARGRTLYGLGSRAVMFGEHITARLASLDPRVSRDVLVHRMTFSPQGLPIDFDIHRGSLRSIAALGYPNFDDILSNPEARLYPMCAAALELASRLWVERTARVGMPDWESAFDCNGKVLDNVAPGVIGQAVVHELMVATNIAATGYMRAASRPVIYRNHGPRPGGPGGRYELVCHGNNTLGTKAYAQFSSPLRDYVNLVNQRNLCAVLDAGPAPYSVVEHTRICADSNLWAQRADALARAKAALPSDDAASTSTLERLDAFAFRRTVRHRGGFDWRTLPEFIRRMDQGLLTHSDAAWVLFAANSPGDDSVRTALLDRLCASPGEFERVWSIGRRDHSLIAYNCVARITALPGQPTSWEYKASAGVHQSRAQGHDPLQARELALVRLAACALGLPPVQPPAPGAQGMRFVETRARERLANLCLLMGWDAPQFSIEEAALPGRGWSASGHVVVSTEALEYRSPKTQGSNQLSVQISSCELAHAALLPYAEDCLRTQMRAGGIDMRLLAEDEARDGSRNALEDFCTRYGAHSRWIWMREYPGVRRFECILEVSAGGNTMRSMGSGPVYEDARADAAHAAISMLLGRTPAPGLPATKPRQAQALVVQPPRTPALLGREHAMPGMGEQPELVLSR